MSPDNSHSRTLSQQENKAGGGIEPMRQFELDSLLTEAMGGLMPEQPETILNTTRSLLDLACGPGSWALQVAGDHPDLHVWGVDRAPGMVAYACDAAMEQEIGNASFQVMDITKPLNIADTTLDFINGRFLVDIMDTTSWPTLLRECFRVLKPGGILRLTETEVEVSSSASKHFLNASIYQAFQQTKRTYSIDGRSLGITHMLKALMKKAGFQKVKQCPFILNASSGERLHDAAYEQAEVGYILLRPLVTQTGIISEEAYDELLQAALIDMLHDDFTCITFGITAWAVKQG